MTHLLAISIGPVQEFIAAARRTRDLWFGSHLLSEISRAVARSIEGQDRQLIFPAFSGAENVANVIVAELASADPKGVAASAKEAAQKRWLKFAEEAHREVSSVIRANIWHDQVDDVIEFYAAWVPQSKSYQHDRAHVMRLLAGRKNCRDFKQPDFNDARLPKSSLDGQRPTVLAGPKPEESQDTYRNKWPQKVRQKLRLSDGEQLDVVGVVKRVAEGNRPYPSVARVAAETWLHGARKKAAFKELQSACAAVPGLNKVAEPKYDYFPYEGTVIFKDRHADLIKELGKEVKEPLKQVATALKDIGGEPHPYLAVLVADGDSMGAALSNLSSVQEHQEFSQKVGAFAEAAKTIVADHYGVLVYAGGDDVLAFVPVHTCLPCARSLRDNFHQQTDMNLSVGLAIGHFMENLEDLRDFGRRAEKAAKSVTGKDALAVHLHKRGGAPIEVRGKWSENPPVDKRLADFAELINANIIPSKLPYELRSMAKLYEGWSEAEAKAAIKVDLIRLIAKKQSKGAETVREKMNPHIIDMTPKKLLALSQELLVARLLATALKEAAS